MARPHIEPYVELNDPYRKFDIAGFRGSLHKVLHANRCIVWFLDWQ
mgnify:CR=1 FL=1